MNGSAASPLRYLVVRGGLRRRRLRRSGLDARAACHRGRQQCNDFGRAGRVGVVPWPPGRGFRRRAARASRQSRQSPGATSGCSPSTMWTSTTSATTNSSGAFHCPAGLSRIQFAHRTWCSISQGRPSSRTTRNRNYGGLPAGTFELTQHALRLVNREQLEIGFGALAFARRWAPFRGRRNGWVAVAYRYRPGERAAGRAR